MVLSDLTSIVLYLDDCFFFFSLVSMVGAFIEMHCLMFDGLSY